MRLAKIVYGTPVCQSYDAVEVHSEVVLTHILRRRLALVERHPRVASSVAGEIHVPIVICLNVGLQREVTGYGVGLPVTIARMHSHRNLSGGVIAFEHRTHHLVTRNTEVAKGLTRLLLQLVAKTPQHHRRRVSVALDELGKVLCPVVHKRYATTGVRVGPLVVELVNDDYAVLVAKTYEIATVGVVRGAYVVHPEALQQQQTLLYGTRIGCGTQGAQSMVVGNAF